MAFPSKEEVMGGDFKVDQETYRADMEEKIERVIQLVEQLNSGDGDASRSDGDSSRSDNESIIQTYK